MYRESWYWQGRVRAGSEQEAIERIYEKHQEWDLVFLSYVWLDWWDYRVVRGGLPVNCQAITRDGKQCSRKAVEGKKFCWQHRGSQIIKSDKLTDKQKRFCEEYIIDLNATQSAIRAGYSDRNADKIGPELLGKTRISNEIQRLKRARSKRVEITADRVLEELSRIGFTDIKDFLAFRTEVTKVATDSEGNPVLGYVPVIEMKDSEEVDGRAISEVSLSEKGVFKFKLHDKLKALQDIGKHLGMFEENVNLNIRGEAAEAIMGAYYKRKKGMKGDGS